MSVTAYPLCWPAGWPRSQRRKHPTQRDRCQFPWARARLSEEIDRLGASDAILSSNCLLNLAGEPRGDQQPHDTGVALYFTLKGRPMVMATDHFSAVSSNLRRLALAIAYLRGLERHGGGIMVERAFTGFAALPDPTATRSCWSVLGLGTPSAEGSPSLADIERAYREQAMKHHPDRGGSDAAMAAINQAREQALEELVNA